MPLGVAYVELPVRGANWVEAETGRRLDCRLNPEFDGSKFWGAVPSCRKRRSRD